MDENRTLATELTQYEPAVFTSDLALLPEPVGDCVLIQPDSASAMVGAKGLIQLPEEIRTRYSKAAETGLLLAVGEGAFTWTADRARTWTGYKPQAGDRVYYKRYSGVTVKGYDGVIYLIMTDHCIGGVMRGNDDGRRTGSSGVHSQADGVVTKGQVSRARKSVA